MTKEATLGRAWREDRRRALQVDNQRNAITEHSVAEIATAQDQAQGSDSASTGGNEVAVQRRRFPDPPRYVTAPEKLSSESPILPAKEHRSDWGERIADCFGVEIAAARALLSRLHFHLSGQGELSPHALNDALAIVYGYAPRNVIEAELVVAMVIASHEADRQIVSGQQGGHLPTILERTRLGQKFLGLQFQALDRLLRVRGLSTQQTIVVKRMMISANSVVLPGGDG